MPGHSSIRCKAVFFDAEGTLFHVRGSVGEIYANIADTHGVKRDPGLLNTRFEEALTSLPRYRCAADSRKEREAEERAWWRGIVAHVFDDLGSFRDFEGFFDAVYEAFAGEKGWQLYSDTLETLGFLQNLGLRMAIISNFDSRLESVTEGLGIRHFFDHLFTPGRVGAAKPDPKIFAEALKALGIGALDAVHVGDSMTGDVQGARAAGITPILLDRSNRYRNAGDLLRIGALSEVGRIVGIGF